MWLVGWLIGGVVLSVRVLEDFCTSCSRDMGRTGTAIGQPLACTRGILFTRLFSPTRLHPCGENVRCISFQPGHITVRSTATRVTLLRFVGTNGSGITIPTSMRYSRLVHTSINTARSLPRTYGAGGRMCSFLGSMSRGCRVKF